MGACHASQKARKQQMNRQNINDKWNQIEEYSFDTNQFQYLMEVQEHYTDVTGSYLLPNRLASLLLQFKRYLYLLSRRYQSKMRSNIYVPPSQMATQQPPNSANVPEHMQNDLPTQQTPKNEDRNQDPIIYYNPPKIVPSPIIDRLWRMLISNTRLYEKFCYEMFNGIIDRGFNEIQSYIAYLDMKDFYQRIFRAQPDQNIWVPYGYELTYHRGIYGFVYLRNVHFQDFVEEFQRRNKHASEYGNKKVQKIYQIEINRVRAMYRLDYDGVRGKGFNLADLPEEEEDQKYDLNDPERERYAIEEENVETKKRDEVTVEPHVDAPNPLIGFLERDSIQNQESKIQSQTSKFFGEKPRNQRAQLTIREQNTGEKFQDEPQDEASDWDGEIEKAPEAIEGARFAKEQSKIVDQNISVLGEKPDHIGRGLIKQKGEILDDEDIAPEDQDDEEDDDEEKLEQKQQQDQKQDVKEMQEEVEIEVFEEEKKEESVQLQNQGILGGALKKFEKEDDEGLPNDNEDDDYQVTRFKANTVFESIKARVEGQWKKKDQQIIEEVIDEVQQDYIGNQIDSDDEEEDNNDIDGNRLIQEIGILKPNWKEIKRKMIRQVKIQPIPQFISNNYVFQVNVTNRFCRQIFNDYRRFMLLRELAKNKESIIFSNFIKFAWQYHIYETQSYRKFCFQLFGRFEHSQHLSREVTPQHKEDYLNTLKAYQGVFHRKPRPIIWPNVEERFNYQIQYSYKFYNLRGYMSEKFNLLLQQQKKTLREDDKQTLKGELKQRKATIKNMKFSEKPTRGHGHVQGTVDDIEQAFQQNLFSQQALIEQEHVELQNYEVVEQQNGGNGGIGGGGATVQGF